MTTDSFSLRVWGNFACFTRPEMKVERHSYPVMTPSAARGVFDAIYIKPNKFYWQIERIEILAEPQFINLRRNEVLDKGPSETMVKQWISGTKAPKPIFADQPHDIGGSRTQRQTIALKNVDYRVWAHMEVRTGTKDSPKALSEQFLRRTKRGQCFYQPYLGCREFPAYFELEENPVQKAIQRDLNIGWMVYDVFNLSKLNTNKAEPHISLFRAKVKNGVLHIPEYHSEHVRKPNGG